MQFKGSIGYFFKKSQFRLFFVIIANFLLIGGYSWAISSPEVTKDIWNIPPFVTTILLAGVGLVNALVVYIYITGQSTNKLYTDTKISASETLITEKMNGIGVRLREISNSIIKIETALELGQKELLPKEEHKELCNLKMEIIEEKIKDCMKDK